MHKRNMVRGKAATDPIEIGSNSDSKAGRAAHRTATMTRESTNDTLIEQARDYLQRIKRGPGEEERLHKKRVPQNAR